MNIRNIAFLACRFFALYVLFTAAGILADSVAQIASATNPNNTALAILIADLLVSLVAFLVFWFKADDIALGIAGHPIDPSAGSVASRDDMQSAGFAIVGMLVLVQAIPRAGNAIGLYFAGVHNPFITAMYIQIGLQLIIGVALLLGAGRISNALSARR